MNLNFGDIIMVDLSDIGDEHIQHGIRPAVVIGNSYSCASSGNVSFVPLTTRKKRMDLPCHVVLRRSDAEGLRRDSMVLGELPMTRSKSRVIKVVGKVYPYAMEEVVRAVHNHLSRDGGVG